MPWINSPHPARGIGDLYYRNEKPLASFGGRSSFWDWIGGSLTHCDALWCHKAPPPVPGVTPRYFERVNSNFAFELHLKLSRLVFPSNRTGGI